MSQSIPEQPTSSISPEQSDRGVPRRLQRLLARLGVGKVDGGGGEPDGYVDTRPYGYSVTLDDYPIRRAPYDLTQEEALEAVKGLSNYLELAYKTLAMTPSSDQEDEPVV